MYQLWSWLLTAIGVTGIYLAGRRSKAGWAIGIAAQLLWAAYAVTTRQWGFIVSAVAYGSVYVTNWRRWRRDGLVGESAPDSGSTPSRQTPVGGDPGEDLGATAGPASVGSNSAEDVACPQGEETPAQGPQDVGGGPRETLGGAEG